MRRTNGGFTVEVAGRRLAISGDEGVAAIRSAFPSIGPLDLEARAPSLEIVTAPDDAAEKLRFTMEHSDDPELSMVARLRLARVLAYRDRDDEALAVLNVP